MYKNVIKPVLDFIIALVLLILFLPLYIVLSIIVYIDLGLPLHNLLRYREGKNKKEFLMYKLRTKKLDEDGTTASCKYTRVSKWIDSTRLNEIPQLINVLKGEMSLVGPRPFLPGDLAKNGIIDSKRYTIRPGVTGLAQVNGGRTLPIKEMISLDEKYCDKMSLWLDLKIIGATIVKIITNTVDKR